MSGFQASFFIELMGKRSEYCATLLELSLQQDKYIEADNYTALVEVLGKKQQVLGKMDAMNKEHPSLKQDWLDQRDTVVAEDRVRCDKVLSEIESILEKLMQHEEEATENLMKRRDETQQKLNDISKGVKVNEVYRDEVMPSTHRHLDVGL
jgi:hypothetical protein